MNVFEMVALIVLVSAIAAVAKAWIKSQHAVPAQPSPEQERRMAQLEQRVQALEAVVTDHGYDLRKEFSKLERG
ncbi:MAG TPA: hypothetical protein VHE37_13990 [Nevskiaceae bacterium]|nr:hypothetical protein [Nevskiaceae bacterium]